MAQLKRLAVGVAMTAVTVAVLFFLVRKAPDNIRALYQA